MRSQLWSSESKFDRGLLPTIGQMMKDQLLLNEIPETQKDMVARYQRDL